MCVKDISTIFYWILELLRQCDIFFPSVFNCLTVVPVHTQHISSSFPRGWCLCSGVGYCVLLVNGWWMISDLYLSLWQSTLQRQKCRPGTERVKHWFCWKYQYKKYMFNFINHLQVYFCECVCIDRDLGALLWPGL